MTIVNPPLYTFPRNRESEAEALKIDPGSTAPGDHSPLPAANMFATSKSALSMNLGENNKQIAELVLLATNPLHIWFDGDHLVEADSRRATVGKYFLTTVGEVVLYKIIGITEQSADECGYDVDDQTEELIENPADRLTLKFCYCLSQDDTRSYELGDEQLPREMFERDGSLSKYRDPPPIPFENASESLYTEKGGDATAEQGRTPSSEVGENQSTMGDY